MSWWCPPDGIELPTFAALRGGGQTRSWTQRRPWNLRYSEDQPRDEHGRFGSGGGDSSATTAADVKNDDQYHAFAGVWDISDNQAVQDWSYSPDYHSDRGWQERSFQTKDVVAGQNVKMDDAYIKELAAKPPEPLAQQESPIVVAHIGGVDVVLDGNHRAAAAAIAGRPFQAYYRDISSHLPVSELPPRVRSWSLRYSEDQPRDEHGRFGSGSSDSSKTEASASFSKLNAAAAEFTAADGVIHSVDPAEAEEKQFEVKDLEETMGIDPRTGEDTPAPGQEISQDARDAMGARFTEFALEDVMRAPDLYDTKVAEVYGLGVTGAISVRDQVESEGGGARAAYIDYLGTMGTQEGTGSALVKEAAKDAAARGLPLVGSPTLDAAPWWQSQVGFHGDPLGLGWDVDGLTVEETKNLANS